jgi:hypothetical protein
MTSILGGLGGELEGKEVAAATSFPSNTHNPPIKTKDPVILSRKREKPFSELCKKFKPQKKSHLFKGI